jgi:hypothetical protein
MALPLLSHGYGLSVLSQVVRVVRNPKSLFDKQAFETNVVAWICGECGHIESYVKDPQGLWNAYCDAMRNNDEGVGRARN